MEKSYNARCPAVKRLFREAQELRESSEEYFAQPLEDNLFEWHFTVRGPPDTEFDGGIYHGRIIMPAEYPMKPPNIIFSTANGRFETNKKICLSISGHHPESWQPSWSIRTALLAIIGFMPTSAAGTIGSLEYSAEERQSLAQKSIDFECSTCGKIRNLLKDRTGDNMELQKEAKEVSSQMTVTAKKEGVEKNEEEISTEANTPTSEEASQESSSTSNSLSESISSNTATRTTTRQTPSLLVEQQDSFPQTSGSLSALFNNFILSAAIFLLVALVLRRLFFIGTETNTADVDDIII